jgi:hypothetical protein
VVYQAKVLADSISEYGHRLTTLEVTFPRCVLAEFNTHRMFSRNSASSRAIPVVKQLRLIMAAPFVPDQFGANQAGMQSSRNLQGRQHVEAEVIWLQGRNRAVVTALQLLLGQELFSKHFPQLTQGQEATSRILQTWLAENAAWLTQLAAGKLDGEVAAGALNVHKQLVNRVLEPYMWHTVIVTSTEWSNFFALRTDEAAQRQIRIAAVLMEQAIERNRPSLRLEHQWHLPLVAHDPDDPTSDYAEWLADPDPQFWAQVSAARCARVSYLTHDGKRDTAKDLELYQRLVSSGHMSPLEHVARPMTPPEMEGNPWSGNFHGWHQFRKDVPYENDFSRVHRALKPA